MSKKYIKSKQKNKDYISDNGSYNYSNDILDEINRIHKNNNYIDNESSNSQNDSNYLNNSEIFDSQSNDSNSNNSNTNNMKSKRNSSKYKNNKRSNFTTNLSMIQSIWNNQKNIKIKSNEEDNKEHKKSTRRHVLDKLKSAKGARALAHIRVKEARYTLNQAKIEEQRAAYQLTKVLNGSRSLGKSKYNLKKEKKRIFDIEKEFPLEKESIIDEIKPIKLNFSKGRSKKKTCNNISESFSIESNHQEQFDRVDNKKINDFDKVDEVDKVDKVNKVDNMNDELDDVDQVIDLDKVERIDLVEKCD